MPKQNFWCYDTRKSEDFDELVDEYLKLDVSEYLEKPVPFVFLSFPSEKDPEYHERNPSKGQTGVIITGRVRNYLTPTLSKWTRESKSLNLFLQLFLNSNFLKNLLTQKLT